MVNAKASIAIPSRIADIACSHLEHGIALGITGMELESWLKQNGVEMTVDELVMLVVELIADGEEARI